MEMLALCKTESGPAGVGLRRVRIPEPGPGEILVKVRFGGLCGTDMQIYHWAPRMARRMTALPRVLGHEISGTVAAVGEGVFSVARGDHVSLESHLSCGKCRQCLMDQAHLCPHTQYPGIDFDGGFAEWVVVPARIAWVHPPGVSDEVATLMEPFGIAVHACLEGTGVAGQAVLVSGCGPIGLMAVGAARALGASMIIASDPNPLRRHKAQEMGADRLVDPGEEDLLAVAKDMTGGYGVDVALEFSGAEAGFRASIASVRKGGDFRLVGAPSHPISLDLTQWLLQCPTIHNIHGRRIWRTWQQAVDLLTRKRIDLGPLVSHVLPLRDGVRAFDLVLQGQAVKPLLEMTD
ncbi:alcohol dehydrogenase catalytic domain-containing protein [Telmatospirillum sp. J64-1]|uniref:zinc-binding dehydrogenase n=1 Tax=Telmatospirillum sp. J64-1 TaxID=2502183 RepID=UPI001C8F9B62|nr:alcohol dehydrogenase catalytic domain-containing protein [Telmatospirillum sp. J64-1]